MMRGKNLDTLKWISRVIGGAKFSILVLTVVEMILSASSVAFAWVLKEVIDAAVDGNAEEFRYYIAASILVVVVQIVLRGVKRYGDERTRCTTENRFKKRLFSMILKKDYMRVSAMHSAEWMNRMTSDTVVVSDGLVTIVPEAVGLAVKMVGALFLILTILPAFGYILVPFGVLFLLVSTLFRDKSKALHKDIQEADGKLRIFLQERLSALLIVRSYSKEDQTLRDAVGKMNEYKKVRMKRNHFNNFCNIGFSVLMNGVYVAGIVFCGYCILNRTLSYGSFIAVLQMIGQIQSPFARITGYVPKYFSMLASAERLMEVEGYESRKAGALDYKRLAKFEGIELEDVSFTYFSTVQSEGELVKERMPVVIDHFNLSINRGDVVVFSGPSGCGKSTLLKLIMGIYRLDEGTCYLRLPEGEKVELDERFTQFFSYVPQGNYLMQGTVREMITFGDEVQMVDDKAIWQALRIACAADFVEELEEGLDTVLGERGTGLSEGQMQRIAIARAVFAQKPVLVLDEATSALDEETEAKLLDNLSKLKDKTVLFVSHRPAVLSGGNMKTVSLKNE